VKVRVLSSAEREFAEAVDFYNAERPDLGYELAAEVQRTLERISAFPEAWPLFSRRARRCIVRRFPYGVLYQVRSDCVLVVALLHMKRSPKIWQEGADT
jgi:plasmid stabilization system protein ParE